MRSMRWRSEADGRSISCHRETLGRRVVAVRIRPAPRLRAKRRDATPRDRHVAVMVTLLRTENGQPR